MIQCHAQGAQISKCSQYRYDLRRWWGSAPYCLWIMLNPSTADASVNDRTINKIMGFSDRWGFGGLVVVNLFAYRATDPEELYRTPDPIGPENDRFIMTWACHPSITKVFAGWGAHGRLSRRGLGVGHTLCDAGVKMECLYVNNDGHPKHPLYIANNATTKLWTPDHIREN